MRSFGRVGIAGWLGGSLALRSFAGGPGPQGVERCDLVVELAQFSDIAQLGAAADDYDIAGLTCAGDGRVGGAGLGIGADLVYAFRPENDCVGSFFVGRSNSSFDVAFYVVTDCTQLSSSCVALQDDIGAGEAGVETRAISLSAGTTYYFIVDVGNDGTGGLSGTATTVQPVFQTQIPTGSCGDLTPVTLLVFEVD